MVKMDVEIVLLKRGAINQDSVFLTGFHGIGAVGYSVTSYIVDRDDSQFIGYIRVDKMPAVVKARRDRVSLPFELYKRGDFIIALNEVLPETTIVHSYTKKLAEWVVEMGFKEAVLIGGLIRTALKNPDETPFRVAYTSSYLEKGSLRGYIGREIMAMDPGLKVVGPLALLLAHFEMEGFPAISILPVATRKYEADLKATYTALMVLNHYYGANVDLSEIEALIQLDSMRSKEEKEEEKEEEPRGEEREKYMFYM